VIVAVSEPRACFGSAPATGCSDDVFVDLHLLAAADAGRPLAEFLKYTAKLSAAINTSNMITNGNERFMVKSCLADLASFLLSRLYFDFGTGTNRRASEQVALLGCT